MCKDIKWKNMSRHILYILLNITFRFCSILCVYWKISTIFQIHFAAKGELQRMAPHLLHLVPAARGVLRVEHVRRRRRRELSPMSRWTGEGGAGQTGCQKSQEGWGEKEKWVNILMIIFLKLGLIPASFFKKMGLPRPLFRVFKQTFQFMQQKYVKNLMTIQYTAVRFEPTAFRTWVSSHYH